MKKFFITLLKFTAPFILIVLIYCIADPFKVIWPCTSYYADGMQPRIGINKDHASASTYNQYFSTQQYNAFIFGNSRSIFYRVADWQQHLPTSAHCFHFDASAETLYGIHQKVNYIHQQGRPLRHALLIVDHVLLSQTTPRSGHLFVPSPVLSGGSNWGAFHLAHISAFVSPQFLYTYADLKISGRAKPYMQANNLIDQRPTAYHAITNELQFQAYEQQIQQQQYYTPQLMAEFYTRPATQQYAPQVIQQQHRLLLQHIAQVFQLQHTQYHIIISPLYDQLAMHPADVTTLQIIFGAAQVHNFSGINSITANYTNYYESSHYRPHVARQIMDRVYRVE
ncbi:MAG: hypothetical protein V4613_00250 [Bacteroidota bacterium]